MYHWSSMSCGSCLLSATGFLQQSARRNAPGDLSADSLGSSIAKRMLGAALFDSVADHGISICGSDIAVQLLVTAVCHWLI